MPSGGDIKMDYGDKQWDNDGGGFDYARASSYRRGEWFPVYYKAMVGGWMQHFPGGEYKTKRECIAAMDGIRQKVLDGKITIYTGGY